MIQLSFNDFLNSEEEIFFSFTLEFNASYDLVTEFLAHLQTSVIKFTKENLSELAGSGLVTLQKLNT